jgi:hypothetical protein
VKYLREFPKLIRTVPGERVKRRTVQGLPDVSCTLRRAEEEGHLLLAVNNRRGSTPVTFHIEGLPKTITASEALEGRRFTIRDGTFVDELSPFEVRVYRFN